MVTQLDLLRPIYRQTTHYGHFTSRTSPGRRWTKRASHP